ncbi:MAG: amidohydrolase family protein [Gemmobacter sp.]
MRICDPHIHLWDLSTGLYPGLETPSTGFIGSNAAIARSYLLPEYLAEGGDIQIAAAVHVEAFPTDPLAEVVHVQAMADAAPIPLGIVGNADLTHPDVGDLLDRMKACKALRGIRQVVNLHPDPTLTYTRRDLLADPGFAEGLEALAARGLTFDLQLYPHQTEAAARLIAATPGLTVILNHAGMWADRTLAGWTAWKQALRQLAALPLVHVKISGLGMFDHTWTPAGIRPLILETLDAFGRDRAMFASNFPVDRLFSDFPSLWHAFADAVANLDAETQAALLHDNARRIYRL